jgi:CHAD domain-containing protein
MADRKLLKRVELARRASAGTPRDVALHRVRKAAKRLRYACEALEPVYGADAAKLGRVAKRIQNELGEHQDCVVARARLREFAVAANLAGESSFTYGLLTGEENARAERTLAAFRADWLAASHPKVRRWLRT